jgi:hypothetical protein
MTPFRHWAHLTFGSNAVTILSAVVTPDFPAALPRNRSLTSYTVCSIRSTNERCCEAFRCFFALEFYIFILRQRSETFHMYHALMHKHFLTTIVWGNEAPSFDYVEPFALSFTSPPCQLSSGSRSINSLVLAATLVTASQVLIPAGSCTPKGNGIIVPWCY